MNSFANRLICWQKAYGRHDLPWQGESAYRIWLSEIMLQQTQVTTVIPYYLRFIKSFPDVVTLAAATEEQVLAHWSGLGYYARGRNLHKAAQLIAGKHGGEFPTDLEQILALPGIGRSTAAAIAALARHERYAILDGNVKRVLARYCGIDGWPGERRTEAKLWEVAEDLLPERDVAVYTQALMDMGATVCTRLRPRCANCPVQADCVALSTGRVEQLPAPRPRKLIPERTASFLLLKHGHEIMLEKRPPSGIWGGLWCAPQLDETDETSYLLRNDMEISRRVELEAFTHTFTHFKLHIRPVLLELAHKPIRAQQQGCIWLDVDEALGAAIPSPVRQLLLTLQASSRVS
ncbi:MAG: A/G-specific adenine glycosylase [Gammaproteobacteria bacterium]|nr:A/G-specific adenine glycosylase [Gammaproteobacteria bacterium]MBU1447682.1 A/G-specific adenine glycosylase [Gammaproteobacteria bacterium]